MKLLVQLIVIAFYIAHVYCQGLVVLAAYLLVVYPWDSDHAITAMDALPQLALNVAITCAALGVFTAINRRLK